jgi:hypothetical protein
LNYESEKQGEHGGSFLTLKMHLSGWVAPYLTYFYALFVGTDPCVCPVVTIKFHSFGGSTPDIALSMVRELF